MRHFFRFCSRLRAALAEDRYLSSRDLVARLTDHNTLSPLRKNLPLHTLSPPYRDLLPHILSPLRAIHNHRFLRRELRRRQQFFDTIAKFPLGASQRRAVIRNEDNNLIIAGAGSGKTFTIVAKIKYLISILGVKPENILAISFTHKSAAELQERIATPGVKSCTFHALGLEILRSSAPPHSSRDNPIPTSPPHPASSCPSPTSPPHLSSNHPLSTPTTPDESKIDRSVITAETRTAILTTCLNSALRTADYAQTFRKFGLTPTEFLEIVGTFLSLLKSSGTDHAAVTARLSILPRKALRARAETFLTLFWPLHQAYQAELNRCQLIDFSDMIAGSTASLNSGIATAYYDYVIIDEFQDLSFDRYLLLMALRRQNPALKFFCVGDDWQSIYRFAGSDSALFSYFADYFGPTAFTRIETTYRFGSPLLKFSSNFILQNPAQLKKRLRGCHQTTTLHCLYSDQHGDDTSAAQSAFNQLIAAGLTKDDTILILGRYGFDFQRLKNLDHTFAVDIASQTITYLHADQSYSATFLTVHKSKGLEADYVIVLNCNAGAYGFPSERDENPILSLLLAKPEFFPFSEERRLFYVAITRARKATFLIAERTHPSDFFLSALNFKP